MAHEQETKPEERLPGWGWPTPSTRLLHYFPGKGEPSPCRRYIATMLVMFEWPLDARPVQRYECCAACWRSAPEESKA